jgi:hypothetical protein
MRSLGLQQPDGSSQFLLLIGLELLEPGEPFVGDLDLICHPSDMPSDAYHDNGEMGPSISASAPCPITFRGCRRGASHALESACNGRLLPPADQPHEHKRHAPLERAQRAKAALALL